MQVPADQFLSQLAESGLLTADEIAAAQESVATKAFDSTALAEAFIRQGKLTPYQARAFYQGKGGKLSLGNYVILDRLGEGGMGVVLLARHRRMDRVVALKVVSSKVVESSDAIARFQREVRAAARLNHPQIVTAHDADEVNGTHFLVMEYVDGVDLATLVRKRGSLSVDEAVACVVQAADGLVYAHAQGVIHRDIKPSNLLLDRQGSVKILDMGLARLDDARASDLTGTGQIMGTVDYMSPEQAVNSKHADARADIYSLGMTLYYLLAAEPAYDGETMMERLLAHREQPVPVLREARGEIGPELEAVFNRMVAKKPEARYPTMAAAAAALRACLPAGAQVPCLSEWPSRDDETGPIDGDSSEVLEGFASQYDWESISPFENTFSTAANTATRDTDRHWPDAPSGKSGQAIRPGGLSRRGMDGPRLAVLGGGVLASLIVTASLLGWGVEESTLAIELNEPGATVTVLDRDGQVEFANYSGKQRLRLAVSPGDKQVMVAKAGFETSLHDFEVAVGEERRLSVQLTPIAATAALESPGLASIEEPTIGEGRRENYFLELNPESRIVIPSLSLNGKTPFTLEAYLEPISVRGYAASLVSVGSQSLGVSKFCQWQFPVDDERDRRQLSLFDRAELRCHVAGVWTGKEFQLYVDGHLLERTPVAGFDGQEQALCLGQNGSMLSIGGALYQVRISKGARYPRSFRPADSLTTDADTLAIYHLNEGQGETLIDSSGHNHHGHIHSASWLPITPERVPDSLPPLPLESDPLASQPWQVYSSSKFWSQSFDISCDGKLALHHRDSKCVVLYDYRSGTQLWQQDRESVSSLEFSPDGKYLIIGQNHIDVVDTETGEQVLKYQPAKPTNLSLTANNTAAIVSDESTVKLLKIPSLDVVHEYELGKNAKRVSTYVARNAESFVIRLKNTQGIEYRVFAVESSKPLATLGPEVDIRAADIMDENHLIWTNENQIVRFNFVNSLRDSISTELATNFPVVASTQGLVGVTRSDHQAIQVWDMMAQSLVGEVPVSGFHTMRFMPQGEGLAVIRRGRLQLWAATSGKPTRGPTLSRSEWRQP